MKTVCWWVDTLVFSVFRSFLDLLTFGTSRGGSETSSFAYLHFGVSKSTFGYLVQLSQPRGIGWACLGQSVVNSARVTQLLLLIHYLASQVPDPDFD